MKIDVNELIDLNNRISEATNEAVMRGAQMERER